MMMSAPIAFCAATLLSGVSVIFVPSLYDLNVALSSDTPSNKPVAYARRCRFFNSFSH